MVNFNFTVMSLQNLINQLNFNYAYLCDLVIDIDEKDMTITPNKGLENHPAFTIGHIITAYGLTTKSLGGEYTVNKVWDELFRRNGPGDPRYPTTDKSLYPTKNELLNELKNQHYILIQQLENVCETDLNESVEWRFSNTLPKVIDMIYFMCISHYAMHISQLACWRRAMDLPSSLGRM